MAANNRSIRDFFKPAQPVLTKPTPNTKTPNSPPPAKFKIDSPKAAPDLESSERPSDDGAVKPQSTTELMSKPHQSVVDNSDDDETNSDSSLEDLTDLFQGQSSAHRSRSTSNALHPKTPKRSRNSRSTVHSPLAIMPKYQFNMSMLVTQAEIHDATEASSLRLKTLLDDSAATAKSLPSNSSKDQNGILESVVATRDGTSVDQVLQAIKRTEATKAEQRWYFFDAAGASVEMEKRHFPHSVALENWQRGLAEVRQREDVLLSGFAKDMVSLGDNLPKELVMWILDEICYESKDDIRNAYCDILLSAPQDVYPCLGEDEVAIMFHKLGGRREAIRKSAKMQPVAVITNVYESRDWNALATVIGFLGDLLDCGGALPTTSVTIMCLLVRLCLDRIVWDKTGLLAVVQRAMFQCCGAVTREFWEFYCREICTSIFSSVELASFRLQLLRCIPATSARLHDLRRRLALGFFYEDAEFSTQAPAQIFEFWEMCKILNAPRFKVDKNTDYIELGALIAILDIAVDSGHSVDMDLLNPEAERGFNADVDAVGARIKAIWSSVSDAGASFVSRIEAKEMMEVARHRLIYTVRTRPKPKQGIFDVVHNNNDEVEVRRQSRFMEGRFKRIKTAGIDVDTSEAIPTIC